MSTEQAIRRLDEQLSRRHALRLADANDRAFYALAHDVSETPSLAEQMGESRQRPAGLSDEQRDDGSDVGERWDGLS